MRLDDKIVNKKSKVGIIGLGYVGLSLAVDITKSGFCVIGFDEDKSRVDRINSAKNYVSSVKDDELRNSVNNGLLIAFNDYSQLRSCEVQIICVPTPLNLNKQPDLNFVEQAATRISENLCNNVLVILQSTTFPGTTNDIVKPILERSGMVCGEDFWLAFSPERVDPGNVKFNTINTPRVVGGISEVCADLAILFYQYSLSCPTYKVSSTQVAEMSKLLENTYRNVNTGLVNEFAILSNSMGIDIWEVIEAAKTKPFGFQPFYPGPGVGGHCIPLDPFYFAWKVREYDKRATIVEASGNILDNMPHYVMGRIMEAMNDRRVLVNGSKILLIGVAYKANVNDFRESPSLKLLDLLLKNGASVDYHDPMIPKIMHNGTEYRSYEISDEMLRKYNLIVIMTPHDAVNYDKIKNVASLVFDTRNVYKNQANNIVRL